MRFPALSATMTPRMKPQPDAASTFQTLIRTRRSIRRYQHEPIAPEVLQRILEAGTWAPSAHNRQPWRFVVLTDACAARSAGDHDG